MRTIPFTGTSQTVSGHNPVTESINQSPGILDRFFRRTNSRTRQLEQIVDIESNVDIGSNSRIDSLNPRQLYNLNWLASNRTAYTDTEGLMIFISLTEDMRLSD